jgi:hypothetical protein
MVFASLNSCVPSPKYQDETAREFNVPPPVGIGVPAGN